MSLISIRSLKIMMEFLCLVILSFSLLISFEQTVDLVYLQIFIFINSHSNLTYYALTSSPLNTAHRRSNVHMYQPMATHLSSRDVKTIESAQKASSGDKR